MKSVHLGPPIKVSLANGDNRVKLSNTFILRRNEHGSGGLFDAESMGTKNNLLNDNLNDSEARRTTERPGCEMTHVNRS